MYDKTVRYYIWYSQVNLTVLNYTFHVLLKYNNIELVYVVYWIVQLAHSLLDKWTFTQYKYSLRLYVIFKTTRFA